MKPTNENVITPAHQALIETIDQMNQRRIYVALAMGSGFLGLMCGMMLQSVNLTGQWESAFMNTAQIRELIHAKVQNLQKRAAPKPGIPPS